jgi:osmotically-inducible protein OsmY
MSATISTPFFDSIRTALISSPHVPTKKVNFEADSGNVVLKGHVSSFFQKQMAQEAILRVDGVQMIDNRLEVNWA